MKSKYTIIKKFKYAKLLSAELFQLCGDKFRRKGYYSHVLMFHQIADDNPQEFSVSIDRFKEIIEWHETRGYTFKSIDDIRNIEEKKCCIISFDDGYKNILEAVDYLNSKNIPYCIYITTGFIGNKGFLSEQDISYLSKNSKCTIANHTDSHPKARELTHEELMNEILSSDKILETIIGKKIKHFAFPFGGMESVSFSNIMQLKKMNRYETIATTYRGIIGRRKNEKTIILKRYDASRRDILNIL